VEKSTKESLYYVVKNPIHQTNQGVLYQLFNATYLTPQKQALLEKLILESNEGYNKSFGE